MWTIGRPWLEHQETNNKSLIFCTICKRANIHSSIWVTTGCDTMKLEFVKRHENSAGHKNFLIQVKLVLKRYKSDIEKGHGYCNYSNA